MNGLSQDDQDVIYWARALNGEGCGLDADLMEAGNEAYAHGAVHLFVTVKGQPKAFGRAVDFAVDKGVK